MWKRINGYVAFGAIAYLLTWFWDNPQQTNALVQDAALQKNTALDWFLAGVGIGMAGFCLPLYAFIEKKLSSRKHDNPWFLAGFGIMAGVLLGMGVVMGYLHYSPMSIASLLAGFFIVLMLFFRMAMHILPPSKKPN